MPYWPEPPATRARELCITEFVELKRAARGPGSALALSMARLCKGVQGVVTCEFQVAIALEGIHISPFFFEFT